MQEVKSRLGETFAHPADTIATVRARLPSRETIHPIHGMTIVTTRLNEAGNQLICTLGENPKVQQLSSKLQQAKTRVVEDPRVRQLKSRADEAIANFLVENDPAHKREFANLAYDAWDDMRTFIGKAMFLMVMLAHFLFLALPDLLLYKVGFRSNKKFHLKRVITSPKIWVGEYVMPVASSNCIVIQGVDGKVLIRSPPEPTPQIVQQIKEEAGEPAAFLVTLAHDSYVDQWKKLFPSALVICPEMDVKSIQNRCPVDQTLEEAMEYLQTNFRVKNVLSTKEWTRGCEDFVMIMELEEGKLAASLGCGFCNSPPDVTSPLFWRNLMLGRQGLGLQTSYAYMFVQDQGKAQELWKQLRDMEGLDTILFLHGEPIVGRKAEMKQILDLVNLRNSRWGA
jgi:hypothetical protein